MYRDTIQVFINGAKQKVDLLNSSIIRYFLMAVMAGIYVGLGIMLIFSIGAPLNAAGSPFVKALMGAAFALALTLVIFAGSELFTGNNMIMTIGSLSKEVKWRDTFRIWLVSYLGNLAGALFLVFMISQTGLLEQASLRDFVVGAASSKMNAPIISLIFRGILCNMLVCLAIWMSARAKEDTAKLILIFWCLFGFIGAGFEHSIANMTLLGMGLAVPNHPDALSWAGYMRNLIPVTIGNIIGGAVFIGAVYYYTSNIKIERKAN